MTRRRQKIRVIGTGEIATKCAHTLADRNLGQVVLVVAYHA